MSESRIKQLKDEAKGRPAPRAAPAVKNPSIGAAGLYKAGFPHGLGLLGTRQAELDLRVKAEMRFAGGRDPNEAHKGKNLNLYA
jgi:hypothetical protein